MSLAKTSIQRPLTMIMIILGVSMFGLVSWRNLPNDRMPEIDFPFVTVNIMYPGAGPEEIEINVIKPVEDQISMISGLKNMTSYSMENIGIIMLEFNSDIDGDMAAIEVKDKISQIKYLLPDDIEEPVVSKLDINATPIVTVALLGDETVSPVELRTYADKNLKDKFGQIPGVAQAAVTGGREREIHVTLNFEKMAAHNLSIFSVFPALSQQNALVPAGYVTGKYREFSVKYGGKFSTLEEIGEIQIPAGGYNVRLNEIAQITDAYADVRQAARFKGEQSVEISITKSGDANTVATARQVRKTFERLRQNLPAGMHLEIVEDGSQFISDMIDGTYENLVVGIILTVIILLFFLGDWRLTIIAAVTMPISVIMGFIGMDAMGFTMNTVTMMALAIVVGILVTNAIVVLENITRHKDMGKDPRQAAIVGTDEIVIAVIACTLTNLAVFIPIASISGTVSENFKQLGLTIVFATLASLFLSFTLVPLIAAFILKEKQEKKRERIIDKWMLKLENLYEKSLEKILNNRIVKIGIVAFTVVLFFFTMRVIAPQLGTDFMPSTDEGFIGVSIELPVGTPMSITQDVVLRIEKRLSDLPYLKAISSKVGGEGTSVGVQYARIRLEFVPLAERNINVFQMVEAIRPKLADIPNAIITVAPLSSSPAGGGDFDVEVQILGNNMDTLSMLSERALEVLRSDPELTDFNSSWKGAKPEILITPKREIMEHFGLSGNISSSVTGQSIGATLRFNITGDESAKYLEGGEEYPIRVRLDESSRKDIRDIAMINIMTPRGAVPLEAIADVQYSSSISQINRVDKVKMLNVTANVVSADIAVGTKTMQAFSLLNQKAPLPEGYVYKTGGSQDTLDDTMEQLLIAGVLAILLTLMLLIALLESIPMGLVIFMTLPLGLIGVIWGLFVTGKPISMISMLSTIMLIGVVVNNAILMVDYARQIRREDENLSAIDAIIKSAKIKLKAILMANIAIVVSTIPMALGMGAGGEFRAPFAIAAIGGVIISTMLAFFVIPVIYVWTAPKKELH